MSKNQKGPIIPDFETVIIRGKGAHIKKQQQRAGNTQSVKKNTHAPTASKMAKLDNDNESTKPKRINPEAAKRIVQGRVKLKLNQKQLANHPKIQMALPVLQKYENGQAIPEHKYLLKLQNLLKVKLINI